MTIIVYQAFGKILLTTNTLMIWNMICKDSGFVGVPAWYPYPLFLNKFLDFYAVYSTKDFFVLFVDLFIYPKWFFYLSLLFFHSSNSWVPLSVMNFLTFMWGPYKGSLFWYFIHDFYPKPLTQNIFNHHMIIPISNINFPFLCLLLFFQLNWNINTIRIVHFKEKRDKIFKLLWITILNIPICSK